jgi:pheromone shutdown protein TraB
VLYTEFLLVVLVLHAVVSQYRQSLLHCQWFLSTADLKALQCILFLCRPLLLGVGIRNLTMKAARALLDTCTQQLDGLWL